MAQTVEIKNIVKTVAMFIIAVVSSFGFVACDDTLDEMNYEVKNNGGGTTTDVKTTITREGEYGKIIAEQTVNGVRRDTTVTVYLGKVNFKVSENDTIVVANPTVEHSKFEVAPATTSE